VSFTSVDRDHKALFDVQRILRISNCGPARILLGVRMSKLLLCVALLGLGGIYGAGAAVPPGMTAEELIATRQADMALQTSLLESIMMAIGTDADILSLKDAAEAIAALGTAIPQLFPEGTERGHNTRARPVVWSDRAGFERAAANLAEAARRMANAAATDNRIEFAKANLATVAACSACHMAYRGARVTP
jgi:cytochrome c556